MPFCNHTLAQTSITLAAKMCFISQKRWGGGERTCFLYPIPYLFCLIKVTLRTRTLKRIYRWGGFRVAIVFLYLPPARSLPFRWKRRAWAKCTEVTQVSEYSTSPVTAYILDQTRTRRQNSRDAINGAETRMVPASLTGRERFKML